MVVGDDEGSLSFALRYWYNVSEVVSGKGKVFCVLAQFASNLSVCSLLRS